MTRSPIGAGYMGSARTSRSSDVIAHEDMDDATRADMQACTGCVAGAPTHGQFTQALADAGLVDVEIRETHRVHE